MPADTDQVYRVSPLVQYGLGRRFAVFAAASAFYVLIWIIGSTIRHRTIGAERLDAIRAAGRLPIYAVWHDRIFLGTYCLRNSRAVFLTSQSFDGEYIARFLQWFGYGVIRGSSTRGGARALVAMVRAMRRGLEMGFTVDGPKGPRHEAKPGALLLAKKTGNPVVPFTVAAKHYWTIKSWDRLQIPWPFTRAKLIFGEPISVAADASDDEVNAKLHSLQFELEKLTDKGSDWTN